MRTSEVKNFPFKEAGHQLMMLRKDNRETIVQLANKTGLSSRGINLAELGVLISLKTLYRILEAYNVHPLDFFNKIYTDEITHD